MSTEREWVSLSPNRLSLPRPLAQQYQQLCSVVPFSFSSAGAVAFMTAVCNFCANWKLLEVLLSPPRTLLERLFDSSFSNLSLFFSRTVIYGGNLPMRSYVGSDGISPSGGGVLGL